MNDTDQVRAEIGDAITRCLDEGWTTELLLHAFRRDRLGGADLLEAVVRGEPLDDLLARNATYLCLRLAQLGRLPGGPAIADHDGLNAKVVSRVRALLAKAESTTFEAESEALTAKAQELVTKHAIDLACLHGKTTDRSQVHVRHIALLEPYLKPKFLLLSQVAGANGCRSLLSAQLGIATVFGAAADLQAVELLFTSLLAQATSSMLQMGKGVQSSSTKSFRHTFLISYAGRIGERLHEAMTRAVDDASMVHDDLLPILRDRADAVDVAVSEACPRTSNLRVRGSSWDGAQAGRRAAERASLGRPSVGGSRPTLPAA